ncbi:ornithine carbamoyltransferase [Clostridium pasteurianum DSM 525 = ATCC 6013]|uniref:Ornithine carbamoyltransferase n=1 Tax=Clostridium pasteurianum DSM 525 = ATCC 6013 TaxID=1262449 RepID=A0A0H3IXQ0_CLOPA|nr:ornithine carbamoyltransferase [Clostridium pasteurianum]AJA46246.1 ornithine carbamoyltransferase [Clostridium pasteurianum DSM 525 = ATCC 6013]AJA50234.1 ornithine carbamoyltransferase [Clostridium pasteurianum DSM 525 = ATCC 6013]AOZ73699.1 ornithine carbamoyltransferase [Clostridium pasteurianum DSM 525 = ATCC 6013]AOZ77496.1 ornithine carbamoyltransferase [Clostridium pasteurianum]ELP60830.1 Ornithine carbomoyltransferase [Clostridium pasteurianum DSM 525 = ATCC 6013]
MVNLQNRNFLTLKDFSAVEINYLLDLAAELKESKKNGTEVKKLQGKNIALIFEKDSTRTRCSFEVGAYDQGANVTYLGPTGTPIGNKESIKDTARVLGRMFDGIEYRGFEQEKVEILAEHAKVPVWNGLTDEDHPTQVLADLLTIRENFDKPLNEVTLVYCGDGRNNTANALMIGACKMGMDFRIATPKSLFPKSELIEECTKTADKSGGKITITDDIDKAVLGADVLYSDIWVSMGEDEEVWKNRLEILYPYQVNKELLKKTNNDNVKFMHCLPSFHDLNTTDSKAVYDKFGIEPFEVTDEVFESDASLVFEEAENRMHTIKAVMVATLA